MRHNYGTRTTRDVCMVLLIFKTVNFLVQIYIHIHCVGLKKNNNLNISQLIKTYLHQLLYNLCLVTDKRLMILNLIALEPRLLICINMRYYDLRICIK